MACDWAGVNGEFGQEEIFMSQDFHKGQPLDGGHYASSAPAVASAAVSGTDQVDPHDFRIISQEQQQKAFRSAKRHSRRVAVLKWGLPVIALVTVVSFVSWVIDNQPAPPEVTIEETSFEQDELIMQKPKLNGFSDGRAYEVVAERAVQKVATPDVVDLQKLEARIKDEKEQWANITAQTGQFNQTAETMKLDGDVTVQSSLGYGLATDGVEIEMKKGYMRTTSPVEIKSKDIILSAQQLEAIDNGEQFRFSGRVKLRIDAALLNQSSSTDNGAVTPSDTKAQEPAN